MMDFRIDRISKPFLAKLAYVMLKVVSIQGIVMDTSEMGKKKLHYMSRGKL